MATSAAVSPVRAGQSIEFGLHKMPDPGSSMATLAKDPDLVNEIALLHEVLFLLICKDNQRLANEISLIHPYHFFGDRNKKMLRAKTGQNTCLRPKKDRGDQKRIPLESTS